MFPCDFKRRGCPAVFERKFGLRIHLRSCIHKKRRNDIQKATNNRYTLPITVKEGRNLHWSNGVEESDYNGVGFILSRDNHPIEEGMDITNLLKRFGDSSKHVMAEPSAVDNVMLKLGHISRSVGRRCVSELIEMIRSECFSVAAFRKRCSSAKDCTELEEEVVSSNLVDHDFKLVVIKDPETGIECDIHIRSLISFLRKQINGCSGLDTIFNPNVDPHMDAYSHPMLARLGREGVPAVVSSIMSNLEEETLWCTDTNNGGWSFVGMLQLYSDKSRTTLKESAFQFYPFHVTLLNFSDNYRRQCILNGLSLVAFLPVSFYRNINGERVKSGINRLERLNMLHLSIRYILSELKEVAYRGFSCEDKEGSTRVCHPCIGSYCCDLPESKDLSSVKNGNSSMRNCHRCMARTNTFNLYTKDLNRKGEESVEIIKAAKQLRKNMKGREADRILYSHSLVEQVPCFDGFPFMGTTSVLDFHAIFIFEPLHNFHLGISKELKRCLSERLRAENLFSSALPTKGGKERTSSFRVLRLTILHGINNMLSHIQTFSPAKGLRIDFSNSAKGSSGSGLYIEEGKLVGMLEAKDYKVIDKVSPFIGMLVDRCCDESETAPTTTLFVQYVDIMQMSMSYNRNSYIWTDERICKLKEMIELFKKNAVSLYGTYHASNLCTEKFHQLDHICEDIRNMGGLRSGDAGLYEHEHTDIKRANRSGSRKTHTAMIETVSSYVKDKYYISRNQEEYSQTDPGKPARVTSSKIAIKNDSVSLVKSGVSFTIGDLDLGRKLLRKIRIAKEQESESKILELNKEMKLIEKSIRDLLQDIGEVGCRILVKETLNARGTNGMETRLDRNTIITRVASGYVSGISSPTSENYDKRWNKIRVTPSTGRLRQRIVSNRGFGGSSVLRQDSVLIQASDPSSSGSICLWVGKVLGLFHLPSSKNALPNESGREETEYAFVQFYDAVPPVDKIDRALGCIRLVWATAQEGLERRKSGSGDFDNESTFSPWYSLIPVNTIRGVAHVIRGDYGVNGIGVLRDVNSVLWHKQHFYVNRFYFESDETKD